MYCTVLYCTVLYCTVLYYYITSRYPLRGWPARLRGHKGSGLWKVWTVPSPPLPFPPLPSPPLPCTPCPALLPCPAPLPCPSIPRAKFDQAGSTFGRSARVWRRPGDQRVDTIKLGPAVWPKRASVAPPWRSASENEGSQP